MIIGVDAGTSVTKAAAFDRSGRAVAAASQPTRVLRPAPGQVEQDLDEVVDTVAAVVKDVAAALPEPVTALALTGQGDGLWLRDGDGHATRPPISWLDGRAGPLLERWRSDGVVDDVYRRTGSGMFPGCHGPLLATLLAEEPAALDRAVVAGYCTDAIAQRLTGTVTVDASDASLPFLDVARRRYDAAAIAACGLSDLTRLLPAPAPPGTVLHLDRRGAALLDLPLGLPVTCGPFDLPACALGSGVAEPGEGLLTIGTTLACQVLTDSVDIDPGREPAGMFLCVPDPGRWLRAMPAMVGTASLEWLLDLLGLGVADLGPLLADSPPGAHGVSALPFLSPSGERAPFVDTRARAQVGGVSLESTRADIVRAVCEGIAFAARHCLEEAGLAGRLAVCGGGTASGPWTQVFADVIGRPLEVPAEPEVGARGAVMVAWAALGEPVDEQEWRAGSRTVAPRPETRDRYDEAYLRYRRTLATVRPLWRE